ncbi:MAG TPA: glutathione S-transferase family protein [Casimicrobiaceae bacterium]|nr:glutathione S-transferase family protein [Casimicrobiaceae bacterium]
MSLVFYYGSGSPFAWKVQLALEYKTIPYERKVLSFSAGDTKRPEFLALNPRGRVPTIDDNGFVLYESNAIVEYLDEAYSARGPSLFPGDARARAIVRRLICEVDNYLYPALEKLLDEAFKKPEEIDRKVVAGARDGVIDELRMLARTIRGDYLAGSLSAADLALYPLIAFLFRVERKRLPELEAQNMLPDSIAGWRERIMALDFIDRTIPPHWTQS